MRGLHLMKKKIYSAGIVSQRFWFFELKQYIEMLNEGKTEKEIKELSENVNIFGAISNSRAKETFNGTRRRANALGKEMQALFPILSIDNQKLVALIAVLLLNDLFVEFLLEVYQVQQHKGVLKLSATEYNAFFSEKQRTNDVVAKWKPYTYHRLSSAYRTYLLESGLIRDDRGTDIITPKVIDSRILKLLEKMNRTDIIKAIGGYN